MWSVLQETFIKYLLNEWESSLNINWLLKMSDFVESFLKISGEEKKQLKTKNKIHFPLPSVNFNFFLFFLLSNHMVVSFESVTYLSKFLYYL